MLGILSNTFRTASRLDAWQSKVVTGDARRVRLQALPGEKSVSLQDPNAARNRDTQHRDQH